MLEAHYPAGAVRGGVDGIVGAVQRRDRVDGVAGREAGARTGGLEGMALLRICGSGAAAPQRVSVRERYSTP